MPDHGQAWGRRGEARPRLTAGDRVAVVAPSGPVDPGRLERGCALLRSWGLDVVLGAHVLAQRGYLAGADADRARDLQDAWLDPDVRAVLCARGGYGAARLLDHLDWATLAAAAPKPLLGSSDVTALHLAFGARLGVTTLFGPMVATAVLAGERPDARTVTGLHTALLASRSGSAAPTLRPATPARLAAGRATGRLVGGTLSVLAAASGTAYSGSADGGIVLLEDVNEPPYKIDRYLTQLLQAGWFAGVRGVALGSWQGCGDPARVLDVVAERLGPLGVPILGGLALGHGEPQLTVPLGATATLDADTSALQVGTTAARTHPA